MLLLTCSRGSFVHSCLLARVVGLMFIKYLESNFYNIGICSLRQNHRLSYVYVAFELRYLPAFLEFDLRRRRFFKFG